MDENSIDVAQIMADITYDVEKRYSEIEKWKEFGTVLAQVSDDIKKVNGEVCIGLQARNHLLLGEIEKMHSLSGIPWKLPSFETKKPLLRGVFRFIARVILKLTRFITAQQNDVNNTVTRSLGLLQESTVSMSEWSRMVENTLKELTNAVNQMTVKLNDQNDFPDEMYLDFERRYRGSEEDIKKRQDYYIQKFVLNHVSKDGTGIVVDLGCGRGEWLNLLKQNGYVGIGVDLNKESLKCCEYSGVNTVHMDAMCYLKTLPSESVKLLTSFQLVEHLNIHQLLQLFQEIGRVMRKDGLVIIETPNPVNVNVGAAAFYLDPTHIRPVHPQFLEFLAEKSGIANTEIAHWQDESIHAWWDQIWQSDTTNVKDSNMYRAMEAAFMQSFWCSSDYALIGIK